VRWLDSSRREPRSIRVLGTAWKTDDGIRLGTTLKELEQLNGRPFTLAGFGWDYSGTVYGWNGGELGARLERPGRVLLRLAPQPNADDGAVLGEGGFPSNDPAMQALNPTVYDIIVEFAEPVAAPAAPDDRAALTGRWVAGSGAPTLALDINSDGTLLVRVHRLVVRGVETSGSARGRWTFEGRRFSGQIESSDTVAFPRGHAWNDEVVRVSQDELILRNEAGQIESYARQ
jgi:hypothetical protein